MHSFQSKLEGLKCVVETEETLLSQMHLAVERYSGYEMHEQRTEVVPASILAKEEALNRLVTQEVLENTSKQRSVRTARLELAGSYTDPTFQAAEAEAAHKTQGITEWEMGGQCSGFQLAGVLLRAPRGQEYIVLSREKVR